MDLDRLLQRIQALPAERGAIWHGLNTRPTGPLRPALQRLAAAAQGGESEARTLLAKLSVNLATEEARWTARAQGKDPEWTTLQALYARRTRVPSVQRAWVTYLTDWGSDPPDTTIEPILGDFREFLRQELDLEIEPDGLIQFDRLTRDVRDLVVELPVVLYHHTSSTLASRIRREGLRRAGDGRKATNPYLNSKAGVYVTTDPGRDVVSSGYLQKATSVHGGDPLSLRVRTTVFELEPDPDDQDIPHLRGRQFVLGQVRPQDIGFPHRPRSSGSRARVYEPWDTTRARRQTYAQGYIEREVLPARRAIHQAVLELYARIEGENNELDEEATAAALDRVYEWRRTAARLAHAYPSKDDAVYIHMAKANARAPKGTGRSMVQSMERKARSAGARWAIAISAKIDGHKSPLGFWKKMGYAVVFTDLERGDDHTAVIAKRL